MARAGALIVVACVGLYPAATSAWQLQASICQPGAYFNSAPMLGNVASCGTAIPGLIPHFINHTSFTASECNSTVTAGPGDTVPLKFALTYLQMTCCMGAPMPLIGMCGQNYDPSLVCADPDAFAGDAEVEQHCSGDEDQPEEICRLAGEGAWNPMESESCNVQRTEGDNWTHAEKCHLVGGVWETRTCVLMAVDLTNPQSDYSTCDLYRIGTMCCVDPDGTPGMPTMGLSECDYDEPEPERPSQCIPIDMGTQERLRARGLRPVECSEDDDEHDDEHDDDEHDDRPWDFDTCCPNECPPASTTSRGMYESYYCSGLEPIICQSRDRCGVCHDDNSAIWGDYEDGPVDCEEAHWVQGMVNPSGGPFYSKKFCEDYNGKVIDALYTDDRCTNEYSRGHQGSVFQGDSCNCH